MSSSTTRSASLAHVLLLLALTTSSTAAAEDQQWCTAAGEALEQQQQWEAAVDAYLDCSSEHASKGPVAAWSMYRAFNVLHSQLQDRQRALTVCKAGWFAQHAPELAWCAGMASYFLQQYSDAKQWAERAMALGCFSSGGSCQPLIAGVPAHSQLLVQSCSWEGPYDVLAWAHKGLGDAAAEAEARRQYDDAKRAREKKGKPAAVARPAPSAAAVAVMRDRPRVAVGFVTAHRPALFQRTFNSFRQRCLDCNRLVKAGSWMAIDDFSSADDLADMQVTAPPCFVTWLSKPQELKGHIGSLNTLLQAAWGYDFLVHVEDDWLFIQDEQLITAAVDIMRADPTIGQVLFNQDYLESDTAHERQLIEASPQLHTTSAGTPYVVHTFVGGGDSPEWQQHLTTLRPGAKTNFWWPHFSFRPGVWRMSAVRQLGLVDAAAGGYAVPEHSYATRFTEAGFKTAFLPGVKCLHLSPTAKVRESEERGSSFDRSLQQHGVQDVSVASAQSAYTIAAYYQSSSGDAGDAGDGGGVAAE